MLSTEEMSKELVELKQRFSEQEFSLHRFKLAQQQLTEENANLQLQMDSVIQKYSSEIEKLQQERYCLQMKVTQQSKMADSYQEDLDSLKRILKKDNEAMIERVNAENAVKVSRLQKEEQQLQHELNGISGLQNELDQTKLSETQLLLETERLECLVNQLQSQLEQKSADQSDNSSYEVARMDAELNNLKKEKMLLLRECSDARTKADQSDSLVASLRLKLATKEEEIEERQCEITSCYNSMERLREEIQELKTELDLARMEANKIKSKGNSLFAEVEDRRVEAEKELITFRIQNETLKRQLDLNKQNLFSIKMQMAALLQLTSVEADQRHMDKLTEQLSQARGEIQTLTNKLSQYEKNEKEHKEEMLQLNAANNDNGQQHYLRSLLINKENEISNLQKELQTKRLLMLAESDKLAKCQRDLYFAEQQLGAQQSKNTKLSLRIEELQLKYEPDTLETGTRRKVRTEQICLAPKVESGNPGEEGRKENSNPLWESLKCLDASEKRLQKHESSNSDTDNKVSLQQRDDRRIFHSAPSQSVPGENVDKKFDGLHDIMNKEIPKTERLVSAGSKKRVNFSEDVKTIETSSICPDEAAEESSRETSEPQGPTCEMETSKVTNPTKGRESRGRERHQEVVSVSRSDDDCKTQ